MLRRTRRRFCSVRRQERRRCPSCGWLDRHLAENKTHVTKKKKQKSIKSLCYCLTEINVRWVALFHCFRIAWNMRVKFKTWHILKTKRVVLWKGFARNIIGKQPYLLHRCIGQFKINAGTQVNEIVYMLSLDYLSLNKNKRQIRLFIVSSKVQTNTFARFKDAAFL